ncbi:MAG: nuclear transport factor 2 family protein [Parvibaculum sp.]
MTPQEEIAALGDRIRDAHAARDVEALAACYASEAFFFDLAPPLLHRGFDPASVSAWFATWEGPIGLETRDEKIVIGGDSGWSAALRNMRGTKKDGEKVDLWFRTTTCFAKRDGKWLIVHDHASVPFYMDGSFRAATDLTPEKTEA